MGSGCDTGVGSPLGVTQMLWDWTEVLVAQPRERTKCTELHTLTWLAGCVSPTRVEGVWASRRKGTPWRSICTCPGGKPSAPVPSLEPRSRTDVPGRPETPCCDCPQGGRAGPGFPRHCPPLPCWHPHVFFFFFFRVRGKVYYREASCCREGPAGCPACPRLTRLTRLPTLKLRCNLKGGSPKGDPGRWTLGASGPCRL